MYNSICSFIKQFFDSLLASISSALLQLFGWLIVILVCIGIFRISWRFAFGRDNEFLLKIKRFINSNKYVKDIIAKVKKGYTRNESENNSGLSDEQVKDIIEKIKDDHKKTSQI